MKSKVIVGILGAFGLVATLAFGALPGSEAGKTVRDGVYTSEQADRGEQVVVDFGCTNCHGTELQGGAEEQPPLLGEQFVNAWTGRKLDELAAKITTMPADRAPAYQVKAAGAADVVAYLLRSNGYPAGDAELPSDADSLRQIEIVAP